MNRTTRIFTALIVVLVIGRLVLLVYELNIRNSEIELGSGEALVESTSEATAEDGTIPFASPPAALAFNGDSAGSWDIFIADAQGNFTNLTGDDVQYHDYFASFSIDGENINFISNRGGAILGPSQVKPDGTELRSLSIVQAIITLAGEGLFDWDPAWSPTGDRLLWSSLRDLNLELYVIPTDAEFVVRNATRLTNTGARDWFGSWSPNGEQVAFSTDRDGNENIYVVSAEGGEAQQFTTSDWDDIHAMWSLDGTQIAYVYDDGDATLTTGKLDVWVMNADGTNARLLDGVFTGDPVYSRDGSQLAYVSNESGQWQVYVMNADGSNVRRVSPDDGNYLFPVWKP
jgi:Tol biopolymer transport system component